MSRDNGEVMVTGVVLIASPGYDNWADESCGNIFTLWIKKTTSHL